MQSLQLSDVYIYPVKSLTGIRVERWPVNAKGLLYDRRWMLIDEKQHFLSQRHLPRMTLMRTELTQTGLVISAPDKNDLHIGLNEWNGHAVRVQIWHDECVAHVVSEAADQWFSEFLNYPCQLVFHPDNEVRNVDPNYASPHDQTAFSDGFPFLVISENSLKSLNAHLPRDIGMERFRPNLVVSGCPAYAEDYWREIRINDIDFRLPKPCSRCAVPTIDPLTAEMSKEPLQTLNQIRKSQNKVYFGQNAVHNNVGTLYVGADISILKEGPQQPLL